MFVVQLIENICFSFGFPLIILCLFFVVKREPHTACLLLQSPPAKILFLAFEKMSHNVPFFRLCRGGQ